MRLKQIKLSGFKSFVDLTKVPFPHQMTAIVGPNGCGKSNIIDAVRWVLGESSAKNLRGDAMTDVIFNGANSRKAVGFASVELMFDNTQVSADTSSVRANNAAKLAQRTEISVRRQVNREGQNQYFLNGSKCRRRDITDIFLGTGLGPRSYAIIEQGTISRLIESKPQELRVFIEEAAGISQYKERRRETELKIKHTVENLSRLNDIRFEVEQQLEKLHIQAEAATSYKALKHDERQHKAQLLALQWRTYQQHLEELVEAIDEEESVVNELSVQHDSLNNKQSLLKQENSDRQQRLDVLQQSQLEVSNRLVVSEQALKYANLQQEKNAQAREKLTQKQAEIEDEMAGLSTQLSEKQDELEQQTAQLVEIEAQLNQNRASLSQAQLSNNELQLKWNDAHQALREQQQQQSHLLENNERLMQEKQRIIKQLERHQQINTADESLTQIAAYQAQLNELAAGIKATEQELTIRANAKAEQEKAVDVYTHQLLEIQNELTFVDKSIAHIQAQHNQADLESHSIEEMLEDKKIAFNALFKTLTIEERWIPALTTLLGETLTAPAIENLLPDEHIECVLNNTLGHYSIFDASKFTSSTVKGSIAEKMSAKAGVLPWLNHVFTAETLLEAYQVLQRCRAHESVVCVDGTWLGHGFIIKGNVSNTANVLNNELELSQLATTQQQLERRLTEQKQQLNNSKQGLVLCVQSYQECEKKLHDLTLAHQATAAELKNYQARQIWQKQQLKHAEEERKELDARLTQIETELKVIKQSLAAGELSLLAQQEHETLRQQRETQHQNINNLHQTIENNQALHRHLMLSVEQLRMQHIQLMQNQQHATANVEHIKQQLTQLNLDEPAEQEHLTLAEQVKVNKTRLTSLVEEITQAESDKQKQTQESHKLEHDLRALGQEINKKQTAITQGKINLQNYRVRCDTVTEQLNAQQLTVANILETVPSYASEQSVQRELTKVVKQLAALGPINLAAIDEYERHISRKNNLDLQYEDLTQAISTLESAMAKIDQESRHKFKATFEQVNKDLNDLFPKVFGGGSAYLALTSTDMLESGVTIMARPPGKKNSTIHLLSGGEKALTALSLVFAIFKLNPAPFCMLDEVDAPLDDANVGRFCNLVREMSQTVQFIYISHNKIAMEMASHLTGVTMFEPGVSRMVSVDIDEAMAMVEVS